MRQSNPRETASRVNGGDTCEAQYKLPFGSPKGRRGRLSDSVVQAFLKVWRRGFHHVLDEVSMLAPNILHHIEVRSRTGTGHTSRRT